MERLIFRWISPSSREVAKDNYGSASDSRASDLTAGKLAPRLSQRIADIGGRR
jgi:hypothetical protein